MNIHFLWTKIIIFCLLINMSACAPQGSARVAVTEPAVREAISIETKVEPSSSTETEPQDTPSLMPTPAPILVKIVTGTSFPTQLAEVKVVLKDLEKRFNETHSSIQILFMFTIGGQAMDLTNAIHWTQPPDISLGVGVRSVASIHGEWLDLTPFIEADDFNLSRFVGPTIKIHSAQQGISGLPIFSSSDQKGIIGLPLVVYPSVIFYYLEFFDQAQIPYPPKEFGAPYADGDPWTYDKLVEIAQKITASANGPEALSPDQDPRKLKWFGWTHEPYEYGMEYAAKFGDEPSVGVSSDHKTAAFNTQMFKDAMQWDKDTVWKWHIAPSLPFDNGDPFIAQRAAMIEGNTWYVYFLMSANRQGWKIAAVPQGPNEKIVSITDADMTGILKISQHPQEAWEVLKWLYEAEQLKPLVEVLAGHVLGVPEDAMLQKELPSFLAKNYPQVETQTLIEALQYADLINHESWQPDLWAIQEVIELAHREVMTNKDADIDAILEEANAKIQVLLDEYWMEQK
jgi:multiple sugar transport system substrate-binding protein